MTKVPTSLYAATSCGMKFCGTGTLFYKSGVHKLSKIIGARMVPRSRFHTKDPQILCATKQNIVLQATWRPELVHLCHKSNVMNKWTSKQCQHNVNSINRHCSTCNKITVFVVACYAGPSLLQTEGFIIRDFSVFPLNCLNILFYGTR